MTLITEYLFLIGMMLLPISQVNGSLSSYLDIKYCILMTVTAFLAVELLLYRKNQFTLSPYLILLCLYTFLKLVLFGDMFNAGIQLQSLSLFIAACTISTWIFNHRLTPIKIIYFLLPGLIVTLVAALSMILFRIPLFTYFSPFGSPIGLKNSLSVYVAQIVPLLFVFLFSLKDRDKKIKLVGGFLIFVLTSCSLWVIISNRTRSAWWMLIVFFLLLQFVLRTPKKLKIFFSLYFCTCIATSMLLTNYVPNSLLWKSTTPYSDSLKTLAAPSKSHRRIELWQVALQMVSEHPIKGIGTGSYPMTWQNYISKSTVPVKIFRFLRPDLPLFNDYLQSFVENGFLSGLLFALIFLFYPLKLILKNRGDIQGSLLLFSCLLVSVDAFFDYPFNRPENIMIFFTVIAIPLRNLEKPIEIPRRLGKYIVVGVLIFSSLMAANLAGAIYFRRSFSVHNNVSDIKKAWVFWPWDIQWNRYLIANLLKQGEDKFAEEVAIRRLTYWPNDAESYLMLAIVAEHRSDNILAIKYYSRALLTVEGGRCDGVSYGIYKEFKKKLRPGEDAPIRSQLALCEAE